jgi:hypothetical protein
MNSSLNTKTAMLIIMLLLIPIVTLAGDLEPSEPPSSGTMHSLEELYNKQAAMEEILLLFIQTTTRFLDMQDGTVKNMRTGLVWLKNANCTDTVAGIDKSSGTLLWIDAETWSSGVADGACGLTDGSGAGDWRLPTKEELQGIGTDPSATWNSGYPPASIIWTIPGAPFFNVSTSNYWSKTVYTEFEDFRWGVSMLGGQTYFGEKDAYSFYYVWPVRDPD